MLQRDDFSLYVSLSDLDQMSVGDLIAWAQSIVDKVPLELRSTTRISLDHGDRAQGPALCVFWERGAHHLGPTGHDETLSPLTRI
jgi:hypothetical protein